MTRPDGEPGARRGPGAGPDGVRPGRSAGRGLRLWSAAALLVAFALLAPVAFEASSAQGPEPAATYVGSETCAGCHKTEADLWRRSQHRHAMEPATEASVKGDFAGARLEHHGVATRFFRDGPRFMVETDGPDGKPTVYEIAYTFGVEPLQQYLIAFPDGRIQALSVAWDTRPADRGGQRWFHLYPNEPIPHTDELHWTKPSQNWNFMCAECHSTGLRRNYDAAADRFASTWAEISVGCESCHGQGSRHVAWAEARQSGRPSALADDPALGLLVAYAERNGITWSLDPGTGNARRSGAPATLRKEVETCGLCHARRLQQSEDWVPGRWLSETHRVTPLSRGLYHADGQMQDEVYTYGSFKQSRMYAAGVTCSDCHDPHGGKLRLAGDATCLQCHAGDKYAVATHHRHESAATPPSCASCHMPVVTYMVVDPRHDHGFRVPRPDLTVAIGTPNACNACHKDKPAQWAADAVQAWHGPDRKGFQAYGPAFNAAWTDRPDAARLLAAVAGDGAVPAFARAGALAALNGLPTPQTLGLARAGAGSPDPMLRIGALDLIEGAPLRDVWPIAAPLLADPVRGVRIRAVSLLAEVPTAQLSPGDRERFERAAADLVAAQRLIAERPEARMELGNFLARRGSATEAEAEFKAALRLDPQFAPAAVNLADLYRALRRDGEGEAVLRSALAVNPGAAALHHALGLALVRAKRIGEAVEALARAAETDPANPRYGYTYAVALHSTGQRVEAMAALRRNLERHPRHRETLMALVGFSRDAGDLAGALRYAEELAGLGPVDPALARLIQELRARR
ncbi:tetratricopeptide repeat protein [Prosthecomicrobium sp. N25]|uniref:tetratricopeptide repeat protein n=1 Tax=Prosthecomicrobium sp. N25 TaxID=3129254 RepID=UPI0030785C25